MVRVMCEKESPVAVLWRNGVVLSWVFEKQQADFLFTGEKSLGCRLWYHWWPQS